MKLKFQDYKIIKFKKYFAKNNFLFFFQSNKPALFKWKKNEQEFTKLKLKQYKVSNKITLKALQYSIYKNLTPLIGGVILLLNSKFKTTEINNETLKKSFNKNFNLLSVKLNNKMYSPGQIEKIKHFSYVKKVFFLHRSLEKHIKTTHILTKKSK